MPTRVYVAGPMRGIPDFNFPAFDAAAKELRALGYEVFNPTERDRSVHGKDFGVGASELADVPEFDLRAALGDDIAWICANADIVAVLPGWEKSMGANAEVATAEALGLQVVRVGELTGELEPQSGELIEHEASRLVRNGERQKNYGHPRGDFDTIARYWGNHLEYKLTQGAELTAQDVAIMMSLLKHARLKTNPDHHDSRVDGIGYLICLDRLDEPVAA